MRCTMGDSMYIFPFGALGLRFCSNFNKAFVKLIFSKKVFFGDVVYQRLRSKETIFQKYIFDVTFLKESMPGVGLAIKAFANLQILKN